MIDRRQQSDLLHLLHEVVRRWPKADNCPSEAHATNLVPLLANDFNPVDLINGIEAIGEILNIDDSNEIVVITFRDVEGFFQRAAFRLSPSDEWRLVSLKMQCPACFGEGKNDGAECFICGGSGWGVE